jgi:hypothetical protein
MATLDLSKAVYKVIKYCLIFGLGLSILVLIICSALVQDTTYIFKHPDYFISELLFAGLLTALPVVYISHLRGGDIASTHLDFALFFAKIVFIHIGFQLSGIYTILFPKSGNMSIEK